MKEKRYFCDSWRELENNDKAIALITIAILLFYSICCYFISLNIIKTEWGDELNSYYENGYNHLDEIADSVIHEGAGIDIDALLEEVADYELIGNKKGITFKYYLYNKDMTFAPRPRMTVVLSNNYEIISKTSNYSSEEEYVDDIITNMQIISFIVGILAAAFFTIATGLGIGIAADISYKKKHK